MNRSLIVRCALGGLLATSAGCTTDVAGDLGQSDETPSTAQADLGAPPPQPADAGVADGKGVTEPPRGAPGRDGGNSGSKNDESIDPSPYDPSCVSPPKPTDAGIGKDPSPGKDTNIGYDAGIGKDPGVPTGYPSTPIQPEGCFELDFGANTACVSYDDAKLKLYNTCAARGYDLVALNLKDDGTCKPGSASSAWATCCPRKLPSFSRCTIDVFGDGKTCLDPDTIKVGASKACEAIKATLTNLVIDNDVCAGGSAAAEYECCEQATSVDAPFTM